MKNPIAAAREALAVYYFKKATRMMLNSMKADKEGNHETAVRFYHKYLKYKKLYSMLMK